MKRRATVVALALGLLGLTTAPVSGQMFYFPDYAIPSAGGSASTFVAGAYGRGLNDNSGKLNAVSASVGRSGSGVSFVGGFGFIDGGIAGDNEWTLGGTAGYDLLSGSAPAQLSLQAGLGWMQLSGGGVIPDITMLRFPVGVAIKGNIQSASATVTPWAMPRLNILRASADGASNTQTDFGGSAGVTVTMTSGFGIHAAIDYLAIENAEQVMFGVGAHYMLGR